MAKFPRKFFQAVFRNVVESNSLEIEIRLRTVGGRVLQKFYRSLAKLEKDWGYLQAMNVYRRYNIDFTVVPRLRRSDSHHEHPLPEKPTFNCFWADLDVGEREPYAERDEALRALDTGPQPNILVSSGWGLHPYWLLREPVRLSVEEAETILLAIAEKYQGDEQAGHAKRLMRVPNTVNWKRNKKSNKLQRRDATYRMLKAEPYSLKKLRRAWNVGAEEVKNGQKEGYFSLFAPHVKKLTRGNEGYARGLCPFHDDHSPSFSVNLSTGLWKCHSSRCGAEGNLKQFCKRMGVALPKSAQIQRFPRLRTISKKEEWPTERVFEEVHQYVTSQIHFTESWQPAVVALWAMGTYLYMQFPCYGHLWLNSPTTHSGKTKLLDVLWTLCYKAAEPQLEPTPAALFRFPSVLGGTLLLDEVDNLDPEKRSAVISILNSYLSNSVVVRAVPGKNKRFTLEKLPAYCPKVIAGINNLPANLQDRCIKIFLHRKQKSEKVERFMPGAYESLEPLRNQIEAWAAREALRILQAYSHHELLGVPTEADDRAKDMFEPLFAIASVLPKWVKDKLVEAAKSIAKDRVAEEEESNVVVLGLQTLREHFPEDQDVWHLRTEKAFELFSEEIPSIETKAQTQALLRRLTFRSKRVRVGSRVLRAYEIPHRRLERLCERYGKRPEAA